MDSEFEFFDLPGFHTGYENAQLPRNVVVVDYVGVRKAKADIENAIDLYTKSEMRIRVLNKIIRRIERWMNR